MLKQETPLSLTNRVTYLCRVAVDMDIHGYIHGYIHVWISDLAIPWIYPWIFSFILIRMTDITILE